MTTPLQRLGGPERLRDGATWLLAFVGAFATVAGLAGRLDTITGGSLLPVGAIALVVLVVTVGLTIQREVGLAADEGGRPDTADSLVLYQAEGCPHCAKVRRFCTRNGISYTAHNPRTAGTMFTGGTVTNRDRHAELEGYGQDQVPLLVDHERGESLYESDDIVAYLDEHYAR
jgi:glutaredoxin